MVLTPSEKNIGESGFDDSKFDDFRISIEKQIWAFRTEFLESNLINTSIRIFERQNMGLSMTLYG
jgi:hypothetical protein